jgi:hypothetical protein
MFHVTDEPGVISEGVLLQTRQLKWSAVGWKENLRSPQPVTADVSIVGVGSKKAVVVTTPGMEVDVSPVQVPAAISVVFVLI